MKKRLEKFKTKNAKGVLSLMAGNTVAQIIMILGGFVLGRWYGPENNGTYNVFLSFVAILSILTTFRLENIFVISKSSKAIRNLFSMLLMITTLATFIFFLGYTVLHEIFDFKTSIWVVLLSSIAGLFTAWNNVQTSLFTKYQLFNVISTGFVINAFVSVALQFVFLFLGFESNGLIYGTIIGTIISCLYFFTITKGRFKNPRFQLFKQTLEKNKEIVKYTLPSDSLNAVANNLMTILIAFYFTKIEVAFFAMSAKMLVTPLIILSNAMSKVFFQKSASMMNHHPERIYDLSLKVVLYNVGAIGAFLLAMNVIGVYILEWILGNDWVGLHTYVFILSFWILCRSAMNPISQIVVVIRKNHYALYFNIYLVLITIVSVLIGGARKDMFATLYIYSIMAGIGYLIQLYFVMRHLNYLKNKA
ncbi:MAG: oligosaccharide flippase family protein [Flavobacteriaceae bacterium]|nr:oligosaccharide flippase family protein [Candidatus Onthonaster equi]